MNQLWLLMAKIPPEARIDTIAAALETNVAHAKIIHNLIEKNLQKQLILKNAMHKKYSITSKDQEVIDKTRINEIKSQRKPSKLKKVINLHYFEIEKLRKENISWLKITTYLKKEHKIKISDRQLKNLFIDLQNIIAQETNP